MLTEREKAAVLVGAVLGAAGLAAVIVATHSRSTDRVERGRY